MTRPAARSLSGSERYSLLRSTRQMRRSTEMLFRVVFEGMQVPRPFVPGSLRRVLRIISASEKVPDWRKRAGKGIRELSLPSVR